MNSFLDSFMFVYRYTCNEIKLNVISFWSQLLNHAFLYLCPDVFFIYCDCCWRFTISAGFWIFFPEWFQCNSWFGKPRVSVLLSFFLLDFTDVVFSVLERYRERFDACLFSDWAWQNWMFNSRSNSQSEFLNEAAFNIGCRSFYLV